VQWGVQPSLKQGKKYGQANYATKTDGSNPANILESLKSMIEQLIPEDIAQDDRDHLMNFRRLTDQPIETTGDTEFTQNEVR